MTITELKQKRVKAWEDAKAFLDAHTNEDGTISAEDAAVYDKMEKSIDEIGETIARMEQLDALDKSFDETTAKPILGAIGKDCGLGRASDAYRTNFYDHIRRGAVNALEEGTNSEGGYLVPKSMERKIVDLLTEQNVFRRISKVIEIKEGGARDIPIVATQGAASWIAEEGAYTESDGSFGQVTLSAHKVGTLIKISDELLADNVVDLEDYIAGEYARRIAAAEEAAFATGDGSGKPTGITAASGGASVGVTAASSSAITLDEVLDLYYSVKAPYRKNGTWVMSDPVVKLLRKLKDSNGQYLWQPSVQAGQPDMLNGRPLETCASMPAIAASAKVIAFGDFHYYWIADREGRSIKRLNELYAGTGQIGFRASQRVDGKLILSEAVKLLAMKS